LDSVISDEEELARRGRVQRGEADFEEFALNFFHYDVPAMLVRLYPSLVMMASLQSELNSVGF
jgi:hypothetical protein